MVYHHYGFVYGLRGSHRIKVLKHLSDFFPTAYGTNFLSPCGFVQFSIANHSEQCYRSSLSDATVTENISPSPSKPFCMWK